VIELGSEVESVRMLQVCRYQGIMPVSDGYEPEMPLPCYAIQVRMETEEGVRYHYAVDTISEISTADMSNRMMRSSFYKRQADFDGKDYYVLFSELKRALYGSGYSSGPYVRVDVFDDRFRYLGSSDRVGYGRKENAFSKAMVPGFRD
jgi:hypothetical protein